MGNKNKTYLFMKGGNKKLGKVVLTSGGSIDNSISMIELARERYPSKKYLNLSFEVMDARELSFSECFDIVFSNAALHWLKDHRPVVKGAYRGFKP